MPYHVTTDHPDCDAFAVVNDDDGDLMGCHRTQANANEQLAALYVAEADTYPRSHPMAYERRTANDSVELRTEGETVVGSPAMLLSDFSRQRKALKMLASPPAEKSPTG